VVNQGKLIIEAVRDVLSGNRQSCEMPRNIMSHEIRYEKDNLDKYIPWKEQAEILKNCNLPDGMIDFNKYK
jgi:hypothetical protein